MVEGAAVIYQGVILGSDLRDCCRDCMACQRLWNYERLVKFGLGLAELTFC